MAAKDLQGLDKFIPPCANQLRQATSRGASFNTADVEVLTCKHPPLAEPHVVMARTPDFRKVLYVSQ